MSDSYQAIYDATLRQIDYFDSQQLIQEISNRFDISNAIEIVKQELCDSANSQSRPSVLFKPKLSIDGTQWCALYGDDLQDGVAGFGDTTELAMLDFDNNWYNFNSIRKNDYEKI